MRVMQTEVRPMLASDLVRVAELSRELVTVGSPSAPSLDANVVATRFARITAAGDNILLVGLVGVVDGARVVGWIHGLPRWLLETASYVEIQSLVVGAEARRLGVGRALVEQVVEWARGQGFARVRVRSNVSRVEAHSFYPALGFTRVKTQHNYDLAL